ncbi:MAG: exodeoxyribonuclease VII small subunit [Clostridiales bacterium]|nr:exodeoxyribonuclease VII small subunit [Clostridiales bacterium]
MEELDEMLEDFISPKKGKATSADFEEKIEKLQEIVAKLESDVSLEDGMALFESGIKLTKECIDELDRTREHIESLKGELDKILDRSAQEV